MTTFSKTDLMYEITYNPKFVPRRSPRVNVKTMVKDDEKTYIMKNHLTGTYFMLSEFAYDVWDLIDGERTVEEIAGIIQFMYVDARPSYVNDAILFYAEKGALQAVLEPTRKKRVNIVSAFEVRVSVVERSKRVIESVHRLIRPLLRRRLLWVSLAFVVVCSVAFSGQFVSIFADKSNFEILGSSVVGFFFYTCILMIPIIIVHELAHGVALIHYGGVPGEIGTGLFYLGPMFYIDASDGWTLTRRQRMMVFMAGNLSTLMIGSAIVVALFFLDFPASISRVLSMTAFYCFYFTLFNLAPPFETDGYYVLADLVNIPNLRQDAYDYFKTTVKRILRRPVQESEEMTGRKKKILLGYAVLSAAFIAFLVFQTSVVTLYMGQDTISQVLKLSSALLFARPLTIVAALVGVATITYFAIRMIGYAVIAVGAVKKATRGALRFEAVHDRDLSVFLYLPAGVAKVVANDLKDKMKDVAEKLTPHFDIRRVGALCLAVLRMGGAQLAFVQMREHLRRIERAFRSMYQSFVLSREREILGSVGIYSRGKIELTNLLNEMAEQVANAGMPEAKTATEQVIDRQTRNTLYLLNSAFGTVWTIELPPAQLREIQEILLPTFLVADLTITDLYDEVEDFKKRTIYGFDSLANFAARSRDDLEKTLAQPEKYHLVPFFEPVKGRLIFAGRTERIEKDLPVFGSLFVCQAWCSYLDNLLSETNLALSALRRAPAPSADAIQSMKDGELSLLDKYLSRFAANEKIIYKALKSSEKSLEYATDSLEQLKNHFKPTRASKACPIDPLLDINSENLENLPRRFEELKGAFQELRLRVRQTRKLVRKEHRKRKRSFSKKRQKMRRVYPVVLILSIILASAILPLGLSGMVIPFLTAAAAIQIAYWILYFRMWRSFHSVSRYPSPTFTQTLLFALGLTQAVYQFVTTGNILAPTKARAPNPA